MTLHVPVKNFYPCRYLQKSGPSFQNKSIFFFFTEFNFRKYSWTKAENLLRRIHQKLKFELFLS